LKAGGEISYKEGSTESQNIVPRCFRDLLPLTVDFQLPNASTSCGSIGCMGVDLIYRSKQMIEINRYFTPVQIMHELTTYIMHEL